MKTQSRLFLLAVLSAAMAAVTYGARAWCPPQDQASPAPKPAASAPDTELAAIKQTALDYIEGYYEGNAERMERALHPDLAKRIVHTDPRSGRSRLDQMSAMSLVQGTRARASRPTPKDQRQNDVTVLDVFGNTASVKIVATDWIDYLHVAKFNGRWVIVNVLWELKPQQK
ncbi:MAG: nuclear transport factor 2 family protein [Blastocatellia bacterium]